MDMSMVLMAIITKLNSFRHKKRRPMVAFFIAKHS